jgi:Flp pilus assembly protein TadD
MSGSQREHDLERLRRTAENAIRKSRPRREVESLLSKLLDASGGEGEHALFANRHLAELLIEEDPWRAALHLRRVAQRSLEDDVVHALMGLCQALLGNFRAAVSAYRRALRIAPRNPWYHHNLGHLLDVALGEPKDAVSHLESAHRMEPLEHEITASLAHCLARLGRIEEARVLAEESVAAAPRNAGHRSLLAWIEEGSCEGPSPRFNKKSTAPGAQEGEPQKKPAAPQKVVRALERGMREAGFSPGQVASARALWTDFHDGRRPRVTKPEVYAAAVEYAIALVHGLHGVTKASVARRYGVAPGSLTTRYGEIRDALELTPGDPRYA